MSEMVEVPRHEWEAMKSAVAELQGIVRGRGDGAAPPTATDDARTDRRGLLKHGAWLAAGAVAASAVAVVSQAAPAEAANGSNLVLGSSSNSATQATGVEVDGTSVPYGVGVTDNGLGAVPCGAEAAIFGHAKAQAWNNGVSGYCRELRGPGSTGFRSAAPGWQATARALSAFRRSWPRPGARAEPPCWPRASATLPTACSPTVSGPRWSCPTPTAKPAGLRNDPHHTGEIDGDSTGAMWLCVADGTPGTWVRLGAPGSAGAFSVLPSSVRVYDSRPGQAPTSVGPKTPLVGGTARTVDLTVNSSGVPAAANAVLINLTAVPRTSSGFLAAYKAGISFPGTSTLNWSAAGNPIANSAVVAVGTGKINLLANASTDVIVDVIGYYR